MDEPSSALTERETQELFRIINELKNMGKGIIYISHRLEELENIVDRVTVMRDGKYIKTADFKDLSIGEIIALMVGREITEKYPREQTERGKKIMEVKGISTSEVQNISFDLYSGEILGFAGLVGAGRTELVRALFGADKIGLFAGGLSAVIGHIFPVLFKFKGGKGVATSIGVCFVAAPVVSLIAFAIGVAFLLTVKIGALTSFIMTGIPLIFSGASALYGGRIAEGVLALVIYVIVLAAHHANFARIFKGEEKQVILFGKNKSAASVKSPTDKPDGDDGGKA